ncbi:MAG TPA: hypothetical protein VHP38_09430 [Ruminiclostridium sp.]|nr:hypothetical protein [Ruminiclostridium sp.]
MQRIVNVINLCKPFAGKKVNILATLQPGHFRPDAAAAGWVNGVPENPRAVGAYQGEVT